MMASWKPKHVAKHCLKLQTYFINCCVVTVFKEKFIKKLFHIIYCVHYVSQVSTTIKLHHYHVTRFQFFIFLVVYVKTLSASRLHWVERYHAGRIINWKGMGMNRSWVKYYSGIYPEGLRRITNFIHNIKCSGREWNQAPSEYKTRTLPLRQSAQFRITNSFQSKTYF
jgi:hypothetical protein